MNSESLPILPTSVIGSYAYPGWMLTALEQIEQGKYGATDIREVYDDACSMAILDQERAGIDIVSDGEMRRWYFVQSFTKRMTGIVEEPPLRKTGLYGYDSPPRYRAVERVTFPSGLGIVEEFRFTKANTDRPIKVTCPGPVTMTIHVRPGNAYKSRLDLSWQLTGDLGVHVGVGLLDTEITKSVLSTVASGSRLPNAPETNFNVRIDYSRGLANGMTFELLAHASYKDEVAYDIVRAPRETIEDGYWLANLRLALRSSGEGQGWELALWGRNLFDEEYRAQVLTSTVGWGETWGMPRTYGVNLSYRW